MGYREASSKEEIQAPLEFGKITILQQTLHGDDIYQKARMCLGHIVEHVFMQNDAPDEILRCYFWKTNESPYYRCRYMYKTESWENDTIQ